MPTSYNEGLAESVAISEGLTTTRTSAVGVSETVSVAEGVTGIAAVPPVTETVLVSEALAVGLGFRAHGLSATRIRLAFSSSMQTGVALSNPANYTVKSAQGTVVSVSSVTVEADTRGVLLTLASAMDAFGHYSVQVALSITAPDGQSPSPDFALFQFLVPPKTLRLTMPTSGEVSGGLFGAPEGLVFFSPALQTAVNGSIIEVDSVSACTKVADVYVIPSPPDPPALYTWAPGETSVLNTSVLWAKFPGLVEARQEVTFKLGETLPAADDGPATATLEERWDLDYVALLNSPEWGLFDDVTPPPRVFMTADNAGVIPPGASTVIPLST